MHEHGTKTTPVFLPNDGEASWSLLPSFVSLLSGGTVQPGNTYSRKTLFQKMFTFLKKFLDITIQFSQYINAQRCSFIKTTSKPIWKLYVNIFLPDKWL